MKQPVSIESHLALLQSEIDGLNLEIEKKQIAIDAVILARDIIKRDDGNNSDDDTEADEEDHEDTDSDKMEAESKAFFDNDDSEETIPKDELKIMKGGFVWKAKEALRKSRRIMPLPEIYKACGFNKKEEKSAGIAMSQYVKLGKVFFKPKTGFYGLKALKHKY